MGYEYTLKVPKESHTSVSGLAADAVAKLHESLGANASRHVTISVIPEGLLICDHLSDRAVAAVAFYGAVQWLLRHSPNVRIEDA